MPGQAARHGPVIRPTQLALPRKRVTNLEGPFTWIYSWIERSSRCYVVAKKHAGHEARQATFGDSFRAQPVMWPGICRDPRVRSGCVFMKSARDGDFDDW
jgi:hypothetical protein